ncbi:unnamed protein product [Cyprideis torosa]|uniref:DnaJ homolog subfamily C member 16 n=1 Tax=Cyprideis torosa TaxID=163714 RepID=A0A7R8W955_9CRUS|nr:unnamed protein product [Cyprideis torosa]CAG0884028.1 unnamed protein product [Cyprideis torosa]
MEVIFVFALFVISQVDAFDPYRVLNVDRRADAATIKSAYKRLAKKWHPDKNDDPTAEEKFVEINRAYEILGDAKRKKLYDETGATDDSQATHPGRRHPFDDIFEDFMGFSTGGNFGSYFRGHRPESIYSKMKINERDYNGKILPGSYLRPYLILFYTNYCYSCMQMQPIWAKLDEELSPLGLGTASVDAVEEEALTKSLGVASFPHLIFVVDGRAWHYKSSAISVASVIDFLKKKFPKDLVTPLTAKNWETFRGNWRDNKVKAMVFGKAETMRLRYQMVAMEFRSRVAFGYVQLGTPDGDEIADKYQLSPSLDTILVFLESSRPVVALSMAEIPRRTLQDVLEEHKFLVLPRLSSQETFNDLCPSEPSRFRKRLCVLLLSTDQDTEQIRRQTFRTYSQNFKQDDKPKERRVQFLYLFTERQEEFVHGLLNGPGSPGSPVGHVVILWRRQPHLVKYEWMSKPWDPRKLNDTEDNLTREDLWPAVSIFGTLIFIVVAGYVMSYLARREEESLVKRGLVRGANARKRELTPQLRIHELRGETYNGLVRLLKPGCRTIVLIIDDESRKVLIPKFHKIVYPYRRNKSLMFAFLDVTRGLDWFKKLLTLALPDLEGHRSLNINPKNVIGTVLSLNGHRKYYCMYHAKHREPGPTRRASAAFMGFNDSENSDEEDSTIAMESGFVRMRARSDTRGSSAGASRSMESTSLGDESYVSEEVLQAQYDSDILFLEHLLDGLPNWLDRLFEGSTTRYHINYWPDHIGR